MVLLEKFTNITIDKKVCLFYYLSTSLSLSLPLSLSLYLRVLYLPVLLFRSWSNLFLLKPLTRINKIIQLKKWNKITHKKYNYIIKKHTLIKKDLAKFQQLAHYSGVVILAAFRSAQNSGNIGSNGTVHFRSVRNIWDTLKDVHFHRSDLWGRSDQNVPFDLTKLLSPVPLFCFTYGIFRNFQSEIFVEWKAP